MLASHTASMAVNCPQLPEGWEHSTSSQPPSPSPRNQLATSAGYRGSESARAGPGPHGCELRTWTRSEPNSSTPPPHANRGLSSTSVSWAWALRWQRPGGVGHCETGEVALKAPVYLNYPARSLALLDVSREHRHLSIWELSPGWETAGLTVPGPGLCNSASSTPGRGDHGPRPGPPMVSREGRSLQGFFSRTCLPPTCSWVLRNSLLQKIPGCQPCFALGESRTI